MFNFFQNLFNVQLYRIATTITAIWSFEIGNISENEVHLYTVKQLKANILQC